MVSCDYDSANSNYDCNVTTWDATSVGTSHWSGKTAPTSAAFVATGGATKSFVGAWGGAADCPSFGVLTFSDKALTAADAAEDCTGYSSVKDGFKGETTSMTVESKFASPAGAMTDA